MRLPSAFRWQLSHLPLIPVFLLIAAQTLIVGYAGVAFGWRPRERMSMLAARWPARPSSAWASGSSHPTSRAEARS